MASHIDLYTAGTPNGHKINILVEELGIDYKVHKIDIAKNIQKEDWYLKINRTLQTNANTSTICSIVSTSTSCSD